MKKSLIALAVASVVSAPAFAATSNVDVYGKLNFSVSYVNDQLETTPATLLDPAIQGVNDVQFTSNSSRIGFKGAEDLGGGLSAIWQIESGITLDEGSGSWASRNTFVGLKGAFGTVLGGKHDTPLKLVGRAVDLFADGFADSRNVMGGGSDTRANNVVAYISPSFSGFSLAAAYSTDLGTGTSNVFDDAGAVDSADRDERGLYNVNATYANGPLYLGLAYGDGDGHEALGLGSHWRAAAGFTFGNFKIVGQYDNLEDDSEVGIIGLTQPGDFDAWMVGGSYTMGAMVFKANYMEGEYDGDALDTGYENSQWTVGMDYNLSKRTTVYAFYVDGENIGLGFGAGLADKIVPSDEDVSGITLGVSHAF